MNKKQPLEAKHVKVIAIYMGVKIWGASNSHIDTFRAFLRPDDLCKVEKQDIVMEKDQMKILLVRSTKFNGSLILGTIK